MPVVVKQLFLPHMIASQAVVLAGLFGQEVPGRPICMWRIDSALKEGKGQCLLSQPQECYHTDDDEVQ